MPDGSDVQSSVQDAQRGWLQRFLGYSSAAAPSGDKERLARVKELLDGFEAEVNAREPNYQKLAIIAAEMASSTSPLTAGLTDNADPGAAAQANRAMMIRERVNTLQSTNDLNLAVPQFETLRKRVGETSTQPVGERVRLLSNYQAALTAPGPLVSFKKGMGAAVEGLTKKVERLDGQITGLIAAARQEGQDAIMSHAAELLSALEASEKAGPKEQLAAIDETQKAIAEDGGLAKRLKLDVGPAHKALEAKINEVRELYVAAFPQQKSAKGLADADKVSKPLLGGVPLSTELDKLIAKTEGLMSAGKTPNVADVAAHVQAIQDFGFCGTAEENMKALGSWDAAKAKYKSMVGAGQADEAKKMMSELWWYRRQLVDGTMLELQKKYDFAWGSVGSANLESDYDVTVRTHGKMIEVDGAKEGDPKQSKRSKYDYQIVAEFNEIVSGKFGGTAPGIVLDTNLYAEAAPDEDKVLADLPLNKDLKAMRESGQDVGALMKLRRFMDEEEYQAYMEGVLDGLKSDPAAYKVMKTQFEEADANYQIARLAQLEATAGSGNPNQLPAQDGAEKSPIERQSETLQAAEALDENGPQAMATNNKLYLDALVKARELEDAIPAAKTPEEKEALFSKLKGIQAIATFFAAEAYHSEGPLKHVVQAAQSSAVAVNSDDSIPEKDKPQKIAELTKAAMQKLTPTQLLQSFNENNGDLLKDIKHYEHASPFPGLGFYRCSKYLERMCDAAGWISGNLKDPDQKKQFDSLQIGKKSPAAVKGELGKLVAIRGGKKEFKDVDDPETEKEAFAIAEMKNVFSEVTTLRDLAGVANTYSIAVNTLIRKFEANAMSAQHNAAFFAAGAAPR